MTVLPSNSNEDRLARIFSDCAEEMLADLGVQATRLMSASQPAPTDEALGAFVCFGNAELHGCLTLQAPRKLLHFLNPVDQTSPLSDLDDWACEMVNQVVGRFRNRVAAYAVKLVFGVPLSLLSQAPQFSTGFRLAPSRISFTVDNMALDYWLELETEPDFWLAESPLEDVEAALKEGTLVLF